MSPSLRRLLAGIVAWGDGPHGNSFNRTTARRLGAWRLRAVGLRPALASPVAACHLSWLVVLLPLAGLSQAWLSRPQQRVLGIVVILSGFVCRIGICAHEFSKW